MKTRSTTRAALMGTIVATLVTGSAVWYTTPVGAIKEVEGKIGFGLITLAPGQQARLNVVHNRAIDPEDSTSGDGSVRKVTLAFDVYALGTAVESEASAMVEGRVTSANYRFVRRESRQLALRPGEGASFDFTAVEPTFVSAVIIDDPNIRSVEDPNIRPVRAGIDDPNLRGTLEVRDGGRTTFVLSPAAVLFGEVEGRIR